MLYLDDSKETRREIDGRARFSRLWADSSSELAVIVDELNKYKRRRTFWIEITGFGQAAEHAWIPQNLRGTVIRRGAIQVEKEAFDRFVRARSTPEDGARRLIRAIFGGK